MEKFKICVMESGLSTLRSPSIRDQHEEFYQHGWSLLQSMIEKRLEFVTSHQTLTPLKKEESQDIRLFTSSLFPLKIVHDESEKTIDTSSSSESDFEHLKEVVITSQDVYRQAGSLEKRKMKKNEILWEGTLCHHQLKRKKK
jgi:hypothetical protein